MADLVDLENGLVALIAQTLYPNGTSQPSATGVPTIVYAGWPTASRLDADLAALAAGTGGKVHVTVFPMPTERNTTRYLRDWVQVSDPIITVTVTLTQANQQIVVGGTIATPQNVMLMVGGQPYVYGVQPTDSLTSIATALATLIPGAQSVGPVITLPDNVVLNAMRVGGTATAQMEIRRQERLMQITVWADAPARRDPCAALLDVALAAPAFILLADNTLARIKYHSSRVDDMAQKQNLYRRDLFYTMEYATTMASTETQVVTVQQNTDIEPAGIGTTPSQVITVNQ